ncbi:hypothetical protein M9H77_01838 [Catharanthus roseus]|uniref:Uncharacterized protein n=1 Tax=Catharanthus roseus TaxID=4058 RepID=A0ACC0C6Q0_CATRO|nr:hypothetical protein M9H77_01838 [Catharanthus roseus]
MEMGEKKKKVRLDDDNKDEEEEVPVKHKGEKLITEDNWKLYVKDGRHNHKMGVYPHACAQAARLTDDQLKLTEEFSRCQVAPRSTMTSLLEKNPDCIVSKQTTYNARAKMKKKRMEGRCRDDSYGKDFHVATAFIRNEKVETYEWVLQKLKNLYFESPEPIMIVTNNESGYLFDEWLNPFAPKFMRVWTEKDNDKSNPIIAPLCYNLYLQLKLEDVHICWRLLEINELSGIGRQQSHEESDLQKQLLDFTGILREFSTRLPSEVPTSSYPKYLTSCYPIKSGRMEKCKGDGNCGFRVSSYFLYGKENQWPKVRTQMWNEMHEKRDMYWNFYGGSDRFYKIFRGYAHWDVFAPRDCWMDVPNHLILAANTFNLCIVLIAKQDLHDFAILLFIGTSRRHYCHWTFSRQ